MKTSCGPILLTHLARIRSAAPEEGIEFLDPDTVMSPGTLEAALRAVGAATAAVDAVFAGEADNAFCAMRPPGHHAETQPRHGLLPLQSGCHRRPPCPPCPMAPSASPWSISMSTTATAPRRFSGPTANLFYGSTHQMPLYPGTGARRETGVGNIFNAPLRAGDGGEQFREAMRSVDPARP